LNTRRVQKRPAVFIETEERVLAALANGKADEGHVVFANGSFAFEYTGHAEARELHQKIVAMGLVPRMGRYGPFYTLSTILTMGDDPPM
jgi:hypothetical protein